MACTICNVNRASNADARILSVASEIAEVREFAGATPCYRKQRNKDHRKVLFMRGNRKSFAFNISSVANQRVPSSAALIPRKVKSLLLRQLVLEFLLSVRLSNLNIAGKLPRCGSQLCESESLFNVSNVGKAGYSLKSPGSIFRRLIETDDRASSFWQFFAAKTISCAGKQKSLVKEAHCPGFANA
jgi:hypothetical protein